MAYYTSLLKLCGFDDEDMGKEKPRIEEVFGKLELKPEDMQIAEDWVRQNHDIELVGVQKLLRAWLLELFDLALAKEEGKKVIYYGFPSIGGPGMAIKAAAPDRVYVSCPDVVLCHTLGQIFNKINLVLEAGEENGLPPGHSLCSLQQVRVGAMALGMIPVPDLVATSGYYCDMGSKSDELLYEKYGHKAVYIDGSMDSRWGEYPDFSADRVEYLGAQINKFFDAVKDEFGVEVNQETWNKARSISRYLDNALGELAQVMIADPLPISSIATGLAVQLAAASTGRAMTEGPEAVDILIQEAKRRVETGIGVVEKGAPRVFSFAAPHSDPSITRMIENAGLALAATLTTVPPPKTPASGDYTTLGDMRAEKTMQAGFYHSSFGFMKRLEESVRASHVDGLVYGFQFSCRPLALASHYLKKWIEEQVGIPVLSLEMDYYDSRSYSAAALRTRVEAFAEMLRVRKASIKGE